MKLPQLLGNTRRGAICEIFSTSGRISSNKIFAVAVGHRIVLDTSHAGAFRFATAARSNQDMHHWWDQLLVNEIVGDDLQAQPEKVVVTDDGFPVLPNH